MWIPKFRMTDEQKRITAIVVFALMLPLLLFPITRAEDVFTSQIVSSITGKNVFCHTAGRNNPINGCYDVSERITWSNVKIVGKISPETRNRFAQKICFYSVDLPFLILFFGSIYFIGRKTSKPKINEVK